MLEWIMFTLVGLLCGIGLFLSALSFSGTWMVLLGALLAKLSIGFPTLGTLVVFALLCIVVEALEALAGFLGVQKRGGSKLAGGAAILGGLLGATLGSAIFPILGTFIGMLLGSFALAFLVEIHGAKKHAHAAHIALGAVWARLTIMLLKTILTAAMSLWLLIGLLN